ncbi:alkaline phosphatase family protein, partial [bacterium]|nr:alkaline phosphatase family protein [bacterium]MBU1025332.1 alkaline phosphatase family protein [bacterium]
MSKKRNVATLIIYILIPISATVLWSWHYSVNIPSFIRLFMNLIIPSIIVYLVGELLTQSIFPRIRECFRFGFWCGFFFAAPFYVNQVWDVYSVSLGQMPKTVVYSIYLIAWVVASVAGGLISWGIFDLLYKVKNAINPPQTAVNRLSVIILGLILLLPVILKDQTAQLKPSSKIASYRAPVERELEKEPEYNVVVLGIDGADWDVIDSIMKDGNMPNLKRIMADGRWGVLESMEPMRSPMVWTTMFTGRAPENHGILEWDMSNSTNRLVKGVWNILTEYNLRTTMINIPATFPPEEILGKEICGFPNSKPTMNNFGWIATTEPMSTNYTKTALLDLKLDQDGSYRGKITVSDVLTKEYSKALMKRKYKNKWFESYLVKGTPKIYGEGIDIARFRYYKDNKRFEIIPLKGSDEPI